MTTKQRINLWLVGALTVIWLTAAGIGLGWNSQTVDQSTQPAAVIACTGGSGSGNSCGG